MAYPVFKEELKQDAYVSQTSLESTIAVNYASLGFVNVLFAVVN